MFFWGVVDGRLKTAARRNPVHERDKIPKKEQDRQGPVLCASGWVRRTADLFRRRRRRLGDTGCVIGPTTHGSKGIRRLVDGHFVWNIKTASMCVRCVLSRLLGQSLCQISNVKIERSNSLSSNLLMWRGEQKSWIHEPTGSVCLSLHEPDPEMSMDSSMLLAWHQTQAEEWNDTKKKNTYRKTLVEESRYLVRVCQENRSVICECVCVCVYGKETKTRSVNG